MTECKRCSACGETKPLSDFGSHPTCAQGVRPDCKTCRGSHNKTWRKTNDEAYRTSMVAANAKWYAANRESKAAANRRWRDENREVVRRHTAARNAVQAALKGGMLTPEPCLFCHGLPVQAHHHSYAPEDHLSVTWLCRRHHGLVHRQVDESS